MIDPVMVNWVIKDGPAKSMVAPRSVLHFTTPEAIGVYNGKPCLFRVEEIDPLLLAEYREYFRRA